MDTNAIETIQDTDVIESRIAAITLQIQELKHEKDALNRQLRLLKEKQATQKLLNKVFEVTGSNSMAKYLSSSTKTTPILSAFEKSDREFLLLRGIIWGCCLVVVKNRGDIHYINSGLTMTDLKQSSSLFSHIGWSKYYYNYIESSDRLYPLCQELTPENNKILYTNKVIAFSQPIRLGGQTYRNQTGYGWEYRGEDLISKGTLYGETTTFLIIGVVSSVF